MIAHLLRTLILAIGVVILPLLGVPHRIFTWPVLFTLAVGIIINLTQPPVSAKDATTQDELDRRSVLFLYISGILAFMVPVVDYGYGKHSDSDLVLPISMSGAGLAVAGLAFRVWSIRTLGKWFTSKVKIQEGQVVIENGPYKFLRHPSYLGSLATAIGLSVLYQSVMGLIVCGIVFFPAYVYRIHLEETALRKQLGNSYADYQSRTWKMLPGLF